MVFVRAIEDVLTGKGSAETRCSGEPEEPVARVEDEDACGLNRQIGQDHVKDGPIDQAVEVFGPETTYDDVGSEAAAERRKHEHVGASETALDEGNVVRQKIGRAAEQKCAFGMLKFRKRTDVAKAHPSQTHFLIRSNVF